MASRADKSLDFCFDRRYSCTSMLVYLSMHVSVGTKELIRLLRLFQVNCFQVKHGLPGCWKIEIPNNHISHTPYIICCHIANIICYTLSKNVNATLLFLLLFFMSWTHCILICHTCLVGRIISAREKFSLTDLDRFVNNIWEKWIFCLYRKKFQIFEFSSWKMGSKTKVLCLYFYRSISHICLYM